MAWALARQLAALPQTALRHDRLSAYEQGSMSLDDALANDAEAQDNFEQLEGREMN